MRRLLRAAMWPAICSVMVSALSVSTGKVVRAGDSVAAPVPAQAVGMIAYSAGNVFTIQTDGSHRRQLTTTKAYGPVWSPDGATIAYHQGTDIWLMDADGGSKRRLVEGWSPAWAPDGQRLSYDCGQGSQLCAIDLRDGRTTVLVEPTIDWPGVSGSTWSPDGTWIAFARISREGDDYTNERQLFRMKTDGTELTAIPNTAPLATEPAWSPDGATIMYTDRYGGRGGELSGNLWSIRPDGTAKTQVTRGQGSESTPTWSPDGRRLAMSTVSTSYTQDIWTIDPDGTDLQLVVRGAWSPNWRPNYAAAPTPASQPARASGPAIAYVAATDSGFDLFTVRPDGRKVRRLTFGGDVGAPSWSPDRSRIAYGAHPSQAGAAQVRIMDVRTGESTRVARSFDPSTGNPSWSPDGRRLAWGGFDALVVFDLRDRSRIIIPRNETGCCFRDPSWSPDGTLIAFSFEHDSGSSEIMLVPSRGGEFRTVTRLRGLERQPDWLPNGRRILFSHQRSGRRSGEVDVLSIRPDGTGLRRLAHTPALDTTPAWSPDGRRIAMYSDGPRPFGAAPQPGLWTVGPRGGAPQLVVRDRSIAYVDW